MGVCQGGKIWMLTTKNQPSHRNGVSQNALLGNCMYFIFRQMTFLRQNLAENRKYKLTDFTFETIEVCDEKKAFDASLIDNCKVVNVNIQ